MRFRDLVVQAQSELFRDIETRLEQDRDEEAHGHFPRTELELSANRSELLVFEGARIRPVMHLAPLTLKVFLVRR